MTCPETDPHLTQMTPHLSQLSALLVLPDHLLGLVHRLLPALRGQQRAHEPGLGGLTVALVEQDAVEGLQRSVPAAEVVSRLAYALPEDLVALPMLWINLKATMGDAVIQWEHQGEKSGVWGGEGLQAYSHNTV